MSLSFEGGKPCIQPILFGSESAADSGALVLVVSLSAAIALEWPALLPLLRVNIQIVVVVA